MRRMIFQNIYAFKKTGGFTMKFNKFLMLFMVLALSAVLAACGAGSDTDDTSSEDSNKELNLLFASEPPSLHPGLATDTTSGAVIQNTFEGLMTMVNGEAVEAAAESYKVSEDLLTYTFTLRDAKWSNGDPVTAEDFAYAWKWALNPENAF